MKSIISFLLIQFCLVFCSSGCSETVTEPEPPDVPIEVLLNAEDTLLLESKSLVLETYLYWDRMPTVPSSGGNFVGVVFLQTHDSSDIENSFNMNAVYFVKDGEVWKSFLERGPSPPEAKPYQIEMLTRESPPWIEGNEVTVIVSINYDGSVYYLKADNQMIGAVY